WRGVRSANARTSGVAFAGEITGGTTGGGIGLVEGALSAGFAVGMSGIRRYREVLVEPIPREPRDLFQRTGLRKEMSGARHDFHALDAPQLGERVHVELQHLRILGA